jgi:hypothetical protein
MSSSAPWYAVTSSSWCLSKDAKVLDQRFSQTVGPVISLFGLRSPVVFSKDHFCSSFVLISTNVTQHYTHFTFRRQSSDSLHRLQQPPNCSNQCSVTKSVHGSNSSSQCIHEYMSLPQYTPPTPQITHPSGSPTCRSIFRLRALRQKFRVRVRVSLRLTVRQSVCLGVEPVRGS